MSRPGSILVILVAVLGSGCTSPSSMDDPYLPAFEGRRITIEADAGRAVTDRAITITGTCMPLVQGKGRLSLRAHPHDSSDYVMLEMPVHDTLRRIGNSDTAHVLSEIAAEFTPHISSTGQWRFRLPADARNGTYGFSVKAYLDSVFVADSGRFFWYNSEEARKTTPGGEGYDNVANSFTVLTLSR